MRAFPSFEGSGYVIYPVNFSLCVRAAGASECLSAPIKSFFSGFESLSVIVLLPN